MKNVRFGAFNIAIEHKIPKWFAIEISRISASKLIKFAKKSFLGFCVAMKIRKILKTNFQSNAPPLRSRLSGCHATLSGERCVTSRKKAAKETTSVLFWKNQAALKPPLRFSTNKKLKQSQGDLRRLLKLPLSLVCLRRSFLFAKSLLVLPVKAKAYVVRERMFTLWMSFNSFSKNDTAFWILCPLS